MVKATRQKTSTTREPVRVVAKKCTQPISFKFAFLHDGSRLVRPYRTSGKDVNQNTIAAESTIDPLRTFLLADRQPSYITLLL